MRISVLASGSKGNSTLISVGGKNILLDAGMNSLYIEKNLRELGVEPSTIDAIFITHTHTDHVSSLKVFCKKYNPKVIMTAKMHVEVPYITNFEYIQDEYYLGDVVIKKIGLSHDSSDSICYIVSYDNKSCVFLTDTGYINVKNLKLLSNHNAYIFESNHDVEMLMNSSRPHHIKLRILGDKGHLSNEDSAQYLSKIIGPKTKYIILAHLSREANSKELALASHNYENIELIISDQDFRTELIEL